MEKTFRIEPISTTGRKMLMKMPFTYTIKTAINRCNSFYKKNNNISHFAIYTGDMDREKLVKTIYSQKFNDNIALKTN